MFERLESRTLLTMVYDFEPLPAVDLDIGSIAYLEAPHIEVDGDLIARSSLGLARVNDQGVFQFGQEVVSTQPFYAYGGNYYGTGRLREDLFDPGDSTPPHGVIVVGEDGAAKGWYGDVSSPAAEVIASGSLPDGRYRVIVEYSDEFRLGNDSLDVASTLETPSGTTLSLSATRLVGDAPHRPDITTVVRYAYDFMVPKFPRARSDLSRQQSSLPLDERWPALASPPLISTPSCASPDLVGEQSSPVEHRRRMRLIYTVSDGSDDQGRVGAAPFQEEFAYPERA